MNHTLNGARSPVVALVGCHFTRLVNRVRHLIAREFPCCEFTLVVELSLGGEKKVKVPKNLNKFKLVTSHYNIKYSCKIMQH